MSSLNQCNFIGNLGQEPEVKFTASGAPVTNISIACTETWKDKQTGEKQEKTEWVRVTFFGKLAEIAGEWLHKGMQVYISGSMQTDKYLKDGVDTYSTKIIARDMKMLGKKHETDAPASRPSDGGFRDPVARDNRFEDDIAF